MKLSCKNPRRFHAHFSLIEVIVSHQDIVLPVMLAILHLKYIRVAPEGCGAKMLEDTRKKQEEEKVQWEDLILSSVKDVENQAIEAE